MHLLKSGLIIAAGFTAVLVVDSFVGISKLTRGIIGA
jgi:hypothetical protein